MQSSAACPQHSLYFSYFNRFAAQSALYSVYTVHTHTQTSISTADACPTLPNFQLEESVNPVHLAHAHDRG